MFNMLQFLHVVYYFDFPKNFGGQGCCHLYPNPLFPLDAGLGVSSFNFSSKINVSG